MIGFSIETEVSEWFHKSLIDKVLLTCKSDKKSMCLWWKQLFLALGMILTKKYIDIFF